MSYTPGPWHVEVYNEGRNMDIQDAHGRGVLTKENAHAIAALPELVAALEGMLAEFGNQSFKVRRDFSKMVKIEAARRALAQARGE